MQLTACDIMSTPVVTVWASMTVPDLARVLSDKRISGAPVVDHHGKLIGIISEAGILSRRLGEDNVRAIMTTDVVVIGENEPLQEISLLLSIKRINRVPVLRDGTVVGIVSRTDIVRAMAGLTPASAAR